MCGACGTAVPGGGDVIMINGTQRDRSSTNDRGRSTRISVVTAGDVANN